MSTWRHCGCFCVQAQMKDFQHEVDAAIASREEAINGAREKDKRCKSLETDLLQLQEDLAASERSRKALQAERDELSDEVVSGGSSKWVTSNSLCVSPRPVVSLLL